jgi:diguanylate cyclase (GGDEF)-like protein
MKPLFIPAIFLLLIAAMLQTGLFVPTAAFDIYAFHGVSIAGLLLAWRFHSSRIFLSLIVLWLAQQAISHFSSPHSGNPSPAGLTLLLVGVLLPANFVLLAFRREKGFVFSTLAQSAVFVFVESVIVIVLCQPEPLIVRQHAALHSHLPAVLPMSVQLCFAAAALVFLIRFVMSRNPVEGGWLWSLLAGFLALYSGGVGRISTAYFAASAFILASAVVETSYLLAYHDELTGLASRRAFQDALVRLAAPYSIAMVDIDHFKRCNDSFGHHTGDQVLRMLASKLMRVSGGGQAYRCGGEEFAIVFGGKTMLSVLEHLEGLRAAVESSRLRLRGQDRRQQARGPDRRNPRTQRRMQTGRAIRRLSQPVASSEISVTVSIGLADSSLGQAPADVIALADKALYRAKGAGRNRVETAGFSRQHVRAKSAGIA